MSWASGFKPFFVLAFFCQCKRHSSSFSHSLQRLMRIWCGMECIAQGARRVYLLFLSRVWLSPVILVQKLLLCFFLYRLDAFTSREKKQARLP
jgi:hypothetical protein